MQKTTSLTTRRTGVIATYVALVLTIVLYEIVAFSDAISWLLIPMFAAFAATILLVIFVYHRGGIWSFVHRKFDDYDEREAVVAMDALRHGYGIFAVLVLSCLFTYAIFEFRVDVVHAAAFLILAHILPASIIAWKKGNYSCDTE